MAATAPPARTPQTPRRSGVTGEPGAPQPHSARCNTFLQKFAFANSEFRIQATSTIFSNLVPVLTGCRLALAIRCFAIRFTVTVQARVGLGATALMLNTTGTAGANRFVDGSMRGCECGCVGVAVSVCVGVGVWWWCGCGCVCGRGRVGVCGSGGVGACLRACLSLPTVAVARILELPRVRGSERLFYCCCGHPAPRLLLYLLPPALSVFGVPSFTGPAAAGLVNTSPLTSAVPRRNSTTQHNQPTHPSPPTDQSTGWPRLSRAAPHRTARR